MHEHELQLSDYNIHVIKLFSVFMCAYFLYLSFALSKSFRTNI